MMVLPYDESRVLLVLQIDHSRVVGYLAAHWGNEQFAEPKPFVPFVLAAQEHDGGWWEWETQPTLDEGGYPIDYVFPGVPRPIHTRGYANGVQRVIERNPYAGLLVCMHGIGLETKGYGLLPYHRDRTDNPVVQQYVTEQEELRQRLIRELSESAEYGQYVTEENLWLNYKLLQVIEQMGQFVCNRYPFNSQQRKNGPPSVLPNAPVRPGVPDASIAIEVQDEHRAIVRPYPFDVDGLEISFQARIVDAGPYASQEDFLRQYYRGPRVTVSYSLHAG